MDNCEPDFPTGNASLASTGIPGPDADAVGPVEDKRTIRVLIADDHPIVRDGLSKLLMLEDDIEVVGQASDGLEVLELVQRYAPDVVLLDLRMPNMDGLTTLNA